MFLPFHIPDLGAAVGDVGQIIELVFAGDLSAAVNGLLEGQFDAGTKTLASLVGTLVWLAVIGSLLGEFGELGGAAEVLELIE